MAASVKLRHAEFKRGVDDVLKLRPILKAVKSVALALKTGRSGAAQSRDKNSEKEPGSIVRKK
jgi:hypothetical protein